MPLKLILDEDCRSDAFFAALLAYNAANPGYAIDVIRVGDSGAPPISTPDSVIVAFAGVNERVIVSQDKKTIISEFYAAVASGVKTFGLLLIKPNHSNSEIVEALSEICHIVEPEEIAQSYQRIP